MSHGWTWLFWTVAARSGATIWRPPGLVFFVIGGWLFFPALTVPAGALARALGAGGPSLDLAGALARATHPVSLAGMMAFTLIVGPLPEEVGWRGYLLDQVQARWNALSASLIVGLLMWVWHLPLFHLPG